MADLDYLVEESTKIKKAYQEISGTINKNSLMVYSRPISDKFYYYYNRSKVGCIYTGDGNLNEVNLKVEFGKYWEKVGTIQVPHHGSIYDFDKSILKNQGIICPVSVGNNNSYGHPSNQVLIDINSMNSKYVLVTENIETIYIQNIVT